ncbi:hypothetical protein HZB94_04045 [Candidatus Falkowbacteria bacterium]|nr:hypothetical protein [Candidatus Falkowbacteria bacterium]
MRKDAEQAFSPSGKERAKSELQKKVSRAVSHHIEIAIIAKSESMGVEEEKEIREYFEKLSPRERADALYARLMAYKVDKQAENARRKEAEEQGKKIEPEKPDPYLISETKVLFGDPTVKELFLTTYGESLLEERQVRISELGKLWESINKEIQEKEKIYKAIEKDVHLNRILGRGALSSAKSRMARLAENILALEKRKEEIETLQSFPEIAENTDVVAGFQYKKLKEYKKQLDAGFVWLPTRKRIHQETVSAILNHRWPVLIGEAGSGKSDQADAAALELTGYLPTEIECESTTGETQLIKDAAIDSKTGGSFDAYGPLMRAFTGYDDSRQGEPAIETGRIARFDESGRLGPKAYSIIKKARQRQPKDYFFGHPMLPGAGAIWTSNPVGPRYPDRYAPDPAMRRELAEIHVDYPEMSLENPETYEFALTALMDENNYIAIAQEELAPAYEKKEIPEDKQETLTDGSIVIAKDEIIENMADQRHGALWRFCAAIKSLQDSFVYGNAETEKYPDTLLQFKENADGEIEITADGSGEPLTLSTSTVTLGELASWMTGFNERRQKQNAAFRVDTFTEWLNFKINTYLKQADKADKEKLRALFRHFGFLEESIIPDLARAKPLTLKDIGYLSPRVPRPLYVKRPVSPEPPADKEPEKQDKMPLKVYETKDIVLEDGERIKIKVKPF